METKKILGLIISIVVVAGGSVGGYFIWQNFQTPPEDLTWYPDTPIPAANLTFVKAGEDDIVVTLEDIVSYIDNGTIPKVEYNETIDDVEIEQRDASEVSHVIGKVQIVPDGVKCLNYAFDITPFRLVTGIITEDSVFKPEELLKKYS